MRHSRHRNNFGAGLVLASALVVAGCTTTNQPAVTAATATTLQSTIVSGQSTRADIKRLFGDAKEIVFDEGGYELWIYRDHNASAASVNHVLQYVPLVPLLNGGSPEIMSEQTTKEIVFLFDQTGVVKKYRVMQR